MAKSYGGTRTSPTQLNARALLAPEVQLTSRFSFSSYYCSRLLTLPPRCSESGGLKRGIGTKIGLLPVANPAPRNGHSTLQKSRAHAIMGKMGLRRFSGPGSQTGGSMIEVNENRVVDMNKYCGLGRLDTYSPLLVQTPDWKFNRSC